MDFWLARSAKDRLHQNVASPDLFGNRKVSLVRLVVQFDLGVCDLDACIGDLHCQHTEFYVADQLSFCHVVLHQRDLEGVTELILDCVEFDRDLIRRNRNVLLASGVMDGSLGEQLHKGDVHAAHAGNDRLLRVDPAGHE